MVTGIHTGFMGLVGPHSLFFPQARADAPGTKAVQIAIRWNDGTPITNAEIIVTKEGAEKGEKVRFGKETKQYRILLPIGKYQIVIKVPDCPDCEEVKDAIEIAEGKPLIFTYELQRVYERGK